jgi:hypothetical protein
VGARRSCHRERAYFYREGNRRQLLASMGAGPDMGSHKGCPTRDGNRCQLRAGINWAAKRPLDVVWALNMGVIEMRAIIGSAT